MSRTEPLAPMNLPSASTEATAMNSAGTADPSRWSRLMRPRSSWVGAAMASVQSISATSRDDSWTIAPKCLPSSSSGLNPVNRSQASDRKVIFESASIDQTRSGAFWTR